jgi:hypothetical protein
MVSTGSDFQTKRREANRIQALLRRAYWPHRTALRASQYTPRKREALQYFSQFQNSFQTVARLLLQEALMGQRSEPAGFDQVYVIGRDHNPRGARFTMLKDSIVYAAVNMNCRVLIRQPASVSALGMMLPIGTVYGTGKLVTLFVPSISRALYERISEAAQTAARQEMARIESSILRTLH